MSPVSWTSPGKTRKQRTSELAQLLAGATIEPGALIVLPEMFATGFSMNVDAIAEAADGPTHAFLAELRESTARLSSQAW